MFSQDLKSEIAEKVQKILQETNHPELSTGEVDFLLHVDGKEGWSWANIINNGNRNGFVPMDLVQNTNVHNKPAEQTGESRACASNSDKNEATT